jgi:hypothetical protein
VNLQRSLSCWGTTRHRRAFKIAAGAPPFPVRAGGRHVNWAVIRPRDGSPFSFFGILIGLAIGAIAFSVILAVRPH